MPKKLDKTPFQNLAGQSANINKEDVNKELAQQNQVDHSNQPDTKKEKEKPKIQWSPESLKQGQIIIAEINQLQDQIKKESDINKQKEILSQLNQKISQLELLAAKELKHEYTREEIIQSIKKIKKEKDLDIKFEVDEEGRVRFSKAKDKIDQIVKILEHENNKVTRINLGGNELGPQAVKSLAEALMNKNNKVTNISLWRNNLGPQGAQFLAKALMNENNKVTHIYLVDNELDSEAAQSLAEALMNKNNKVTRINLGFNKLGPEGVKSLAEALKNENNKVTHINLEANKIGLKGRKSLKEVKKIKPGIVIKF